MTTGAEAPSNIIYQGLDTEKRNASRTTRQKIQRVSVMLSENAMELDMIGIDIYLETLSKFARAPTALEDPTSN
jgi:hypothetical protein